MDCRAGLATAALCAAAILALKSGVRADERASSTQTAADGFKQAGLESFQRVDEGLYSGGQPQGETAFSRLAELGVKTVISVDGARPNIEAARRFGLRYIHVPIGYDGVAAEKLANIVRGINESPGPVYLHCHHGTHRAAAAAAAACVATGRFTKEQGAAFLTKVGTSRDYAGLWRDVARAQPVTPPAADAPPLPETVEVSPLVARMSAIDRNFDALRAAVKNLPKEAATVTLAEKGALMAEDFREARRHAKGFDESFLNQLQACERLAREIQQAVQSESFDRAETHLAELRRQCLECHTGYRD